MTRKDFVVIVGILHAIKKLVSREQYPRIVVTVTTMLVQNYRNFDSVKFLESVAGVRK